MAVDAGDDGTQRRQVEVIVGVNPGQIGRAERMGAVRTGGRCGFDDPVRAFGQPSGDARAAVAGFLRTVGRVGLLALRGRQAGVIRRLAWRSALGFQFGQARGQAADLPGLRLDLRMLRQDQGDQVVVGQGEEGCAVHASP